MKKTSRTFKRFAAITSASLLAACMVAPMAMTSNAADNTMITITGIDDNVKHTFEVYQIFTGEITIEGEGEDAKEILTNLKWGADVTAYKANENAGTTTPVETGEDVPEEFSKSLSGISARSAVKLFTLDTESESIKTVESNGATAVISGLAPGYYAIKDITNNPSDNEYYSNSAWIVQVANATEVAIKNAQPSIDKQVWDNEGSGGWDETADWNINDKYMTNGETPAQQAGFRLEATVPKDDDLAFYETYKLVFHDSMSAGVTYDGIRSVKVSDGTTEVNVPLKAEGTPGYEVVGVNNGEAGKTWTLTIENLKNHLPAGVALGSKDLTVEVIYNAHLNENAIVHNEGNGNGETYSDNEGTNVNNNNVYLEYSNNPDGFGEGGDTGETTKDTVGVFTYVLNNTKVIESEDGDELPGATFRLYSDEACKNEIELEAVTKGGKTVYAPLSTGTATEMISQEDGSFNIIGLDVGTYYVKEISTVEGYNKIETPWTINISATHSELADGTGAKLVLDAEDTNQKYINNKGTTLPSTGGIGTTVFYLGGGAMVAVAGIYLISKKRMKNTQE